jgi:Family of unknown function (DUF6293)
MSSLAYPTSDLIDTLRIHIAPVGFEVDRIVMPAIKKKADRVWLITHNSQHEDKGNPFVESIEKKLKAEKYNVDKLLQIGLICLIYSGH